MISERRFIPGIFNYCDSWCERCAFTRRCRNFALRREMEREAGSGKAIEDATNAAFWNGLADKLRETTVFGRTSEWADGLTDDLDDGPDPEWEAREEARRQAVRRHELSRLAHDYLKQASAWLNTADSDLKTVAAELLEAAANPFTREDVEEQARQIGEMVEVVGWYHMFISAKVRRAMHGLLESAEPGGKHATILAEVRLDDAHGSGKVALVGSSVRSARGYTCVMFFPPTSPLF